MSDVETEVKFYLSQPEAYLEKVMACGAVLTQPRVLERNIRLDLPGQVLRQAGKVLRLRQDQEVHLTYKDQGQQVEGVLTRREIEFKADDFETTRRFFEALGYEEVAFYEKYRQTYRLGDLLITLDEMPYGTFTEIEGDPPVLIQAAADMLRLDWSTRINKSYLVMFDIFKNNTGFDGIALSFEALAGMHVSPAELGVDPAD